MKNTKSLIGFSFVSLVAILGLIFISSFIETRANQVDQVGSEQQLPSATVAQDPSLVTATESPIPTATVAANVTATARPTAAPTKAPTPAPANQCIITVNGSKYNVYSLRRTHSGGDVFQCNTDMTATFKSQHGTNYSLISRYRI